MSHRHRLPTGTIRVRLTRTSPAFGGTPEDVRSRHDLGNRRLKTVASRPIVDLHLPPHTIRPTDHVVEPPQLDARAEAMTPGPESGEGFVGGHLVVPDLAEHGPYPRLGQFVDGRNELDRIGEAFARTEHRRSLPRYAEHF